MEITEVDRMRCKIRVKLLSWNYRKYIFFTAAAAVFIVCVCLIAYNLGADVNWDLQNYHFYNGYIWLNGNLISDSLATIQSYLDPKLNAFYYILISSLSPLKVNLLIAALQSVAIFAALCVAFLLFAEIPLPLRASLSFLVAFSAIFGPVYWSEIGGTMSDTLLAAPVIFSFLSAIFGYIHKKLYMFAISGLLIGATCGLKLTNLTFLLGIIFSSFLAALIDRRFSVVSTVAAITILGFSSIVGFVALYYDVAALLWKNYDNPVFPYFNNIFRSPYLANYAIHDGRWFPKSIGGYFLLPFDFCSRHSWSFLATHHIGLEIPFRTLFLAEVLMTLPLAVIACIRKRPSVVERRIFVFVASFFVVSLAVWEIMFSYYRYAAVLEVLAPAILAFFMYLIIGRAITKKRVAVSLGVVVLLSSAYSFPHSTWGREPFRSTYFGITAGELEKFNNAVIIVGSAPLGYVLPFFPSSDSFIGIPERIGGLSSRFQKKYLRPINNTGKKIFYIGRPTSVSRNAMYIRKKYKVAIEVKKCGVYRTNFNKLAICPAKRVGG